MSALAERGWAGVWVGEAAMGVAVGDEAGISVEGGLGERRGFLRGGIVVIRD